MASVVNAHSAGCIVLDSSEPPAASPQPANSSESPGPHSAPSRPWENCLDRTNQNAKGEVEVWKDEIGNLLIFASLFSGVVGAFSIESYQDIKEDPAETTVLLLKSILALQLNATNPQPQGHFPIDLDPKTPITDSAKRITIYNFLSLVLSLSVVMAGILCLQWLREYERDSRNIPRPSQDRLGIRYMRHEGMRKWGVFEVLHALPLILLLSLLLFFAGIIELLLAVDKSVAIVTSVMIGITTAFMLITTIAPTILTIQIHWSRQGQYFQCPWKSPQAWIFYKLIGLPIHSIIWMLRRRAPFPDIKDIFSLRDWSVYDGLVYKYSQVRNLELGIYWVGEMFLQEEELAEDFYKCIQDTTMHEYLQNILSFKGDTRRAASCSWNTSIARGKDRQERNRICASHLANVTIFQTLAHLAEKVERGHPLAIIVEQRLKLFFEIKELDPFADLDCPLMGDMAQSVLSSSHTRHKLLDYLLVPMRGSAPGINESHLAAISDIFDVEAKDPHPEVQLFDKTQEALNGWIIRNASLVDPLLQFRAQQVSNLLISYRQLIKRRL